MYAYLRIGGDPLIHILAIILQLMIMMFFNTYVLDLRWSRKQFLTFLIAVIFPTVVLYQSVGPLAIFYFFILLLIVIYRKTNSGIAIFHVSMSLILLVISDNLSGLLLIRYLNQDMNVTTTPLMYLVFYTFIGIIFAFIYKKAIQKILNRFNISSGLTYLLVFICISTVVFIYVNIIKINQSNFYDNVKSNLALFLVFLLFLIISLFVALYLAFQRHKLKNREKELENFETYIASIEEINRDMRRFKHDYVNMLTSLRSFIDDQNYGGLHTYFYEHILEMDDREQLNDQALMMLNNLKIDSLKGLLTTKILQAQSKKIPFYVEVLEEITDIPVDPIKLNRMVGILSDNAIEATSEAEHKEVRVAFIRMQDTILIVVRNTYHAKHNLKVHELFQEGFSTKGKNRGIGLATLLQLKERCPNIHLSTSVEPPYFTQEIEFEREGES